MTAQWPKYAGYLAALIAFGLYSCSERRAGRLDEQIMNLERQHRADSLRADSLAVEARKSLLAADSARGAAQAQVRRSEAIRKATEASNAQAAEARERAEATLRDSSATVDSLRGRIRELVAATRNDSVHSAGRFAQDSTTIAKLLEVVAKDSLALARQTQSYAALEAQYQAEKRLATVYKSQRGGGWRGQVIAAGITYGACRFLVKCQP